jgi:hypothetical protein
MRCGSNAGLVISFLSLVFNRVVEGAGADVSGSAGVESPLALSNEDKAVWV